MARVQVQERQVFVEIGQRIGELVQRKNAEYGDSFNQSYRILEVLYPAGVKPEQYLDMLAIIRVVDKLFRLSRGDQGDESAWADIAGYGILGVAAHEKD